MFALCTYYLHYNHALALYEIKVFTTLYEIKVFTALYEIKVFTVLIFELQSLVLTCVGRHH